MSDSAAPADESRTASAEFWRGCRDIFPIVVATIPFGLVFGTLASHEGLSADVGVAMSAATFAGASQFAALELWTHPLPYLAIFLSVMAVNLRLLLYSAALGRRVEHWPPLTRYLMLGLLSDPIYALAELKGGARLSLAYYSGLAIPLYINWIVTTAAGYVFGNFVERPEVIGLDFVVIAYFIHVLGGFRQRPNALWVILASAAGSVSAYVFAGSPWHFAGGALAGMAVAVLLTGRTQAPA
jgi:predicted branched-subunit amino acid permease